MAQILIHHMVEDYDKWKPAFDGHAKTRAEAGSKGYRLFRKTDNPNDILIVFEWENEAKAREFMASEGLRDAMQDAGVISPPDVFFMEEIESRTDFREGLDGEQLKWTA
jgi:quinol monooxygenase YgiN